MSEKFDILYDIDMQLYNEFNDKLCEINEHLGDIYSYKDKADVEDAEKSEERRLLREAVVKLQKELEQEKEKYKRLSIEAQATAFDEQNKDTETLLRVLLKQGEISLDEKGNYNRQDFDWEENLCQLGLMKKREKNFYIPDDEHLDEYTKQLEAQLKEYTEMKQYFEKYHVTDNETMYDDFCKMQDELEQEKENNKELEYENWIMRAVDRQYIPKDKIRAKIEELNKTIYKGEIPEFYAIYRYTADVLEELLEE